MRDCSRGEERVIVGPVSAGGWAGRGRLPVIPPSLLWQGTRGGEEGGWGGRVGGPVKAAGHSSVHPVAGTVGWARRGMGCAGRRSQLEGATAPELALLVPAVMICTTTRRRRLLGFRMPRT